jgi:hypothetical protein
MYRLTFHNSLGHDLNKNLLSYKWISKHYLDTELDISDIQVEEPPMVLYMLEFVSSMQGDMALDIDITLKQLASVASISCY